jgi:hypothetical protein
MGHENMLLVFLIDGGTLIPPRLTAAYLKHNDHEKEELP